jgi:hypothetical protein
MVVVVESVTVKLPINAPPVAKELAPVMEITEPTGAAQALGEVGTPEVIAVMVAVATPEVTEMPLITTVTGLYACVIRPVPTPVVPAAIITGSLEKIGPVLDDEIAICTCS